MKKTLLIQVAALGHELTEQHRALFQTIGLSFTPLEPEFPAVTCTAQATLRTGLPCEGHGIICNGLFDRQTSRVDFWNQSAWLLPPRRVWSRFRSKGGTVGILFCQQSLGEQADLILSPAPVHKHHGGMIQDCYSRPASLYRELCRRLGRTFQLKDYWGPLASSKASAWIAEATAAVMDLHRPDLLMTYLPHLDYVLQRRGPETSEALTAEVSALVQYLDLLLQEAGRGGYDVIVCGDYAVTEAQHVVFPNQVLLDQGFFTARRVGNRLYPDLYSSDVFAMVDHQVAHLYLRDPGKLTQVRNTVEKIKGVAEIQEKNACSHSRSGELVLVAQPGCWFAYPWWETAKQAPDYAWHVDIHNKIGFDPCELLWGLSPFGISRNPAAVRGTHGRCEATAAVASTIQRTPPPVSLLELSRQLQERLDQCIE